MKITRIKFKNYKTFSAEQTLELKPITVLIGKNSSGKSAIAKLTTLLENSLSAKFEAPLLLMNDGVDLGSEFRDLAFNRDPSTPIEFTIYFEDGRELYVKLIQPVSLYIPIIMEWSLKDKQSVFSLKFEKEKLYVDNVGTKYECEFRGFIPISINDSNGNPKEDLNFGPIPLNVDYIGPFRLVPPRIFTLIGQYNYDKMGVKGENAYSILGYSKLNETGLITKVGIWYKQHFDNWYLDVNTSGYPILQIILTNDKKPKEFKVNIVDVGQGMSQALPLIVRAFMNTENSLIILEQPELHLHQAVHGDLAELFAHSALQHKNNYLIETHSEPFILRLRRMIVEDKMIGSHLGIYSVEYDSESETSKLVEIKVDELGEVTYWPKGVFSESFEEVKAIGQAQLIKETNAQ